MVYRYEIYEPVFGSNVEIFLGSGSNEDIFEKVKRRFKLKDENLPALKESLIVGRANGAFTNLIDDNGVPVVSLICVSDTNASDVKNTIVHECVHLCTEIFGRRGIIHNSETDEVYAYMLGFYSNFIFDKLDKIKGKNHELNNKRKPRRVPKSKGKRI